MLTKTQNFIEKNIKLLLFTEVLFFAIFTYLVMNEISPVNKYDENAYLAHAETILISENYWYLGDRNRMPLFNYFLSIFYNLESSEIENYYNLKYANLGLTSFLAFLFFIKLESKFKNKFIFLNLSFLILIIPTFALIHQLLVESIFFISFSLLLVYFEQLNDNPNNKNSVKLGIMGAVVYFLKFTGLTVFLAISLFSIIFGFLNKRNYFKNYMIAFATFFTLTSPYLIENYTNFNKHIFYNVNSFYIWADSWDEIVEGVRANNDRIGWPTMDESELPSMSKYISEHNVSDIYERFLYGFKSIGVDYFNLSKLGSHISFASIATILLILYFARKEKAFSHLKPNYLDIITILSVGFILVSTAFYSYISTGFRYHLPIAIPLFLIIFLKLDKINESSNLNNFNKIFVYLNSINLLILVNSYINILP